MDSNVNPKRYIGAKYVPTFTELPNNEWQGGYSYERLTIVLYNNNSYTSRKNVPATIGNPEENGDYWVLTGNYNAKEQQIENNLNAEIENRVNADKTFVTNVSVTNENGVYGFKQTINGIESDIGSVEVPQNDPVTKVNDTVVENNESGYEYHTISETLASGTANNIGTFYVAKKQITDISLDETGNNLVIKFVDQTGAETEKSITIKEAA